MAHLYSLLVESSYKSLAALTPLTAWNHFQRLQENQWLSYKELAGIRWRKLQKLLRHCHQHVPFYQRLWREHGVDPSGFGCEADLEHLPTVTKETLTAGRLNGEFRLENRKYQMVRTSGTTGPVFQVPVTLSEFQNKYAGHLRQIYVSGWHLGMKSATLYNSGHPQFGGRYFGEAKKDSFSHYRKVALTLAHRRMSLPPYSVSRSGDDGFARLWYGKLRRYRPRFLETFEFNLSVLMDHIEENGLERLEIPVIYVLGTLSEKRKRRFGKFFSANIFNRYSPHEMEGVAFACDVGRGMHVSIDTFHIEMLDAKDRTTEPNALGHVTLTDLDNYTMPLVRYRIGDLGVLHDEPCSCGRGLPLMADIKGRSRDLLTLADGRLVAPADLAALLQDHEAVRLFQIVQDKSGIIRVNIVPQAKADPLRLREDICSGLERILGRANELVVCLARTLELEPNGKFSLVKRIG